MSCNYLPLILGLVIALPIGSAAQITVANRSGLAFKKNTVTGAAADYRPTHICSGTLSKDVGLTQIKLSTELLKAGVECVAGDFDGNGFLDFALYQPQIDGTHPFALVVFFEGAQIKRVSTLKRPPTQLWPAGEPGVCFRVNKGIDALQQGGGGEYDRTARFNLSTAQWIEDRCGGERE